MHVFPIISIDRAHDRVRLIYWLVLLVCRLA